MSLDRRTRTSTNCRRNWSGNASSQRLECAKAQSDCRRPDAGARDTGSLKASDASRHGGEIDDERFQYPEGDSGACGAFLGRNGQEVLETPTPKSGHSCGLAGRSTASLLIRRSLVRAQVGEPERPEKSRPCRDARPFSLPDSYWRLPISLPRAISQTLSSTLTFPSADQRKARWAMR